MTRGRPEKNNADYFPHYIKSKNENDALFYIENKYKNDGYATWFKLLESLCMAEYHHIKLNGDSSIMRLASKCLVQENTLINIINDLAKLGQFNKCLWENHRVIFSQKLCDSLSELYNKRNNKCITLIGLCTLLNIKCTRKSNLCPLEGNINTQSKVKESKEKKTKEKKPLCELSKTPENKNEIENEKWIKPVKHFVEAVEKANKIKVSSTPETWADDFRLLQTRDKVPRKRIIKVLKWYCKNLKKGLPPFTPEAYGGKTFREKFIKIENAMKREAKDKITTFKELSKPEQNNHDKMESNFEHSTSVDMDSLPGLVNTLSKKLQKMITRVDNVVKDEDLQKLYLQSIFNPQIYFVSYSMWIANEIKTWKEWQGDLNIFSPDEKHFKRFISNILERTGITRSKNIQNILGED